MITRRRPITIIRRVIDALLVVLVSLVLAAVFLGRLVPLTGHQTLVIGGGSMEPTLPIGSAVIIEPVAAEALGVGDIVTMKVGPKHSVFTHRIIRLLTLDGLPYIETKGDANANPDGATIPASAVEGRVAWSMPIAGYLVALLSVPIGILFALALGATLLLAAWILDPLEYEVRPAPVAEVATGGTVTGRAARAPRASRAR